MRPTLRRQHIRNWRVNINPKRINSLPYSKIQAICLKYRQRLLDSRSAPVTPSSLPPATLFIFRPTPSYVLSPIVVSRLTKFDVSSLKSNLRVYESVFTRNSDVDKVCIEVKEQDCIPKFLVDSGPCYDRVVYYGHGQIHVVGMLDLRKTEGNQKSLYFLSDNFQSQLVKETLKALRFHSTKFFDNIHAGPVAWICDHSGMSLRTIGRVASDRDYFDDIVTSSVTLNVTVPTLGLDPYDTCPYARLQTTGIDSGPFTSIWALDGKLASDQSRMSGTVTKQDLCTAALELATQRAMGFQGVPISVDHVRALGESDSDLQFDEGSAEQWMRRASLLRKRSNHK